MIAALWIAVLAALAVVAIVARNWTRDPVCGHRIDRRRAAAVRRWHGDTYHLCSMVCRARFDRDPTAFLPSQPHAPNGEPIRHHG